MSTKNTYITTQAHSLLTQRHLPLTRVNGSGMTGKSASPWLAGHTHIHTLTHTYTHEHTYTLVHSHTYMHAHTYTLAHTHTRTYTHTWALREDLRSLEGESRELWPPPALSRVCLAVRGRKWGTAGHSHPLSPPGLWQPSRQYLIPQGLPKGN